MAADAAAFERYWFANCQAILGLQATLLQEHMFCVSNLWMSSQQNLVKSSAMTRVESVKKLQKQVAGLDELVQERTGAHLPATDEVAGNSPADTKEVVSFVAKNLDDLRRAVLATDNLFGSDTSKSSEEEVTQLRAELAACKAALDNAREIIAEKKAPSRIEDGETPLSLSLAGTEEHDLFADVEKTTEGNGSKVRAPTSRLGTAQVSRAQSSRNTPQMGSAAPAPKRAVQSTMPGSRSTTRRGSMVDHDKPSSAGSEKRPPQLQKSAVPSSAAKKPAGGLFAHPLQLVAMPMVDGHVFAGPVDKKTLTPEVVAQHLHQAVFTIRRLELLAGIMSVDRSALSAQNELLMEIVKASPELPQLRRLAEKADAAIRSAQDVATSERSQRLAAEEWGRRLRRMITSERAATNRAKMRAEGATDHIHQLVEAMFDGDETPTKRDGPGSPKRWK